MSPAPRPDEPEDTPDIARDRFDLNQLFMVTTRELGFGEEINLIFWCIAWVSEKAVDGGSGGGLTFRP
ncbi:hypothetical protein GJ744_008705 [Endocarpon pusillum]|uniref:Uncharacterized protein n=1 Tax=Endocarpon pusillum TaxID=364733 RepID=A0A8H7E5D8_9EURO|nr:hypothetical protein GJ744_008705 [Endocarpon pusillum]